MIDLEKLSGNDRELLKRLDDCCDSYECFLIGEEAEDDVLKMMAHHKSIRLYRAEEYSAGML